MLLSLLPLLLLLAAACYLVWNAAADDAHPIERALTALAGLLDLLASARKTPTSVPIFDFTIASLVLLAELKEARAFPVQKVTRRP